MISVITPPLPVTLFSCHQARSHGPLAISHAPRSAQGSSDWPETHNTKSVNVQIKILQYDIFTLKETAICLLTAYLHSQKMGKNIKIPHHIDFSVRVAHVADDAAILHTVQVFSHHHIFVS